MGCTHPPSLFLSSLPLSHVRALLPFPCSNRPVSLLTLRLAACVSYLSLVKCFCSSIPRSSFFTVLVYYVRVAVTQSCIAHVLEANLFREFQGVAGLSVVGVRPESFPRFPGDDSLKTTSCRVGAVTSVHTFSVTLLNFLRGLVIMRFVYRPSTRRKRVVYALSI